MPVTASAVSVSVLKARQTLDEHLALPRLLIADPEVYARDHNNDDDDAVADHAGPQTRPIERSVLAAEDKTSSDTTDASEADKCGGAEGALPLSADVVGLVRHGGGDVGVCSGGGEEDTEVPDAVVGVIALI